MYDRLTSTTDVPPQFLHAAYLVGKIPFKALAVDPRISYALFIPPESYNDKVPGGLPLLVNIHGTRRDPSMLYSEATTTLATSAPCAVLVPLFPAGLDGPNDLDSYKILRSKTVQSDTALLAILDEVVQRWPGIETNKIFMMGFSGGGQFVHRMLYLYPERLAAVSIGAPGSITRLDSTQSWPKGTADVQEVFGKDVSVAAIRKVTIHLVVGSEDTQTHGGGEFTKWVREKRGLKTASNEQSSPETPDGRLGAIRELQQQWRSQGVEARLDIVLGVGHSSSGVQATVFEFLLPLLQNGISA